MKTFLSLCIGLFLMLAPGCGGGAGPGSNEPPPNSIKPIDKATLVAVEQALKTDPILAGCVITVKAENELVVLQGEVPTEESKAKAELLAKRTQGVARIANHLVVKPQE
ncbi:MAG: BON domain-containing protein [Candidatus Eremiobacterota bacterium]